MTVEKLLADLGRLARLAASAESSLRGDEAVSSEAWGSVSELARLSEDLERDVRSDGVTGSWSS